MGYTLSINTNIKKMMFKINFPRHSHDSVTCLKAQNLVTKYGSGPEAWHYSKYMSRTDYPSAMMVTLI